MREPGYYWARWTPDAPWEVAELTSQGDWLIIGSEIDQIEPVEIDERRIVRQG
jgi:hypothetical protein